ncbi:chromosome-associated kinesin KIF4-like [Saccostrea echinata]|uniref:chromosome-associated kinesin KIF4-like n=1 Tax=Saccostrea echinata TaxID=191078 RepID=UPI002A838E6B|nr:chromosome-associated kinesin KIF4-like [Saccostrea echinata]
MSEGKVIPVRVAVRARPLIQKETNEGCQVCVGFTPDEPQIILGKDKAFTYDYVFNPSHSQPYVYQESVFPLIKHIFKGYNATVLAYGQTGSGKTFTMGGCYEASLNEDEVEMGIIPRVIKELFNGITDKSDSDFTVKVSYLEIHNEDINDLLCPPAKREPLAIREDVNGQIKLPGLSEVVVESFEETMNCLQSGSSGRTTGSTAMNTHSSRSHAIFTIQIEQKKKQDMDDVCKCKFHLVDLAGSERAKRTQAVGERFKEGVNINKGLLSLGNVISALGEESQARNHIPYRDSKLTRLLQDSLGGNSYTLMIACVSPADSNMEETLNTLRYADRARKIKNKPVINRDPQAAEIYRLKQLVQQLQVQLVNTGGGVSLMSIDTTSSSSSSEDLKSIVEKNKQLEEENNKLSRELQRAVDQSTNMCEKAIRLELKCEKLKTKLDKLKSDTKIDLEVLGTSINAEQNPEAKEQIERIRTLTVSIHQEEQEEGPLSIVEEEEEENENDNPPETPDSRARSKEFTLRQAKMNRELQELNRLLETKETLATKMTLNDDQMKSIREQHESQMKELEHQLSLAQKQKEEMQQALDDAKSNANANRIAEQRRLRLKELEQQISQLRKKMTEQEKMLKMKDQRDKSVSNLQGEIQGLKHQRVQLMKRMKEESDDFRKFKQQKDKEVAQLMQKDRKRQFEIAKLQRQNERQQSVLKRKSEEAAAANRRLKEALSKQKQIQQERANKLETYNSSSIGNRVRSWLSHELEVRISIREAKYHLESLLNDRKEIAKQIKELKERLEDETDGPPIKKLAWLAENGDKTEVSFEVDKMNKELKVLEGEMVLRNAQISELQQKIVDADQDIKGKISWDTLHTMVEAKCALKWLMEQAVSSKTDLTRTQGKLKDSEYDDNDLKEEIERLEKELSDQSNKHEKKITALQKQQEEKVLFLLNKMKGSVNVESADEDLKERLKFQEGEIERLSSLEEELNKKSEECEELKKQMTRAMYQNKRMALLPSIDDPKASPFLSPTPKPKIKKKKKSEEEEVEEDWEETEEESFLTEDDSSDEDWRATPMYKRKMASRKTIGGENASINDKSTNDKSAMETSQVSKKSSSSALICKCKTNCSSRMCSCKKKDNVCTSGCGCDVSKCKNRDTTSDQENNEEGDPQATLNSTYNLETSAKDNTHKNPLKDLISFNEGNRSSDEFVVPSAVKTKRAESNDSANLLEGGVKKRRKLFSTSARNNSSTSFFGPLE